METKMLIEKLAAQVRTVPDRADVLTVRGFAVDEIERRGKRLLATIGDAFRVRLNQGDWVQRPGRTLVRLPAGGHAALYHASGAMKVASGLRPLEALFKNIEDRGALTKQVEAVADRLNLREWIGPNESLQFEHLWQIKAAAAERDGKGVKLVLCRAVGAYRHFVGELPVWGPASVVVKLAAENRLDSLIVQVRETTGEVIDRPAILRPEQAARSIALQLVSLLGKSKIRLEEAANPQWMRFGYLALPKRKTQRLLAPVYIAAIALEGQPEAQAYLLAAPATEPAYLPMALIGNEAPPSRTRRAADTEIAREAAAD